MGNKKKVPINLLGVKLKQSREARGMTIEVVAIRLADEGISTKMIDDWEKGFDIPEDTFLYELADLYRVNPNVFLRIKADLEYANQGKDRYHVKKFVGRTFWDVFGNFIITIAKIAIFGVVLFYMIKSGTFTKIKELFVEDTNTTSENYIVDDEYLRMLNERQRKRKDYIKENSDYEAEKTSPKTEANNTTIVDK